jgi:hypothetical protein
MQRGRLHGGGWRRGLGEGACGAESPGTRGVRVAVGEGDGGTAACTGVRVVETGD